MSTPGPQISSFADSEQLAEALTETVAATLHTAVTTRDQASLVVSGGSTPVPLFLRLAQRDLPWERIWITLADERWVDADHEASNERLVRSLLLRDKAAKAAFIPLKNDNPTARSGADECCRTLARIPRPFDLVLLGMGQDGHTASLFPDAPELNQALAPDCGQDCLAISPPQARFERISLSLAALLNARQIILHLTGPDKKLTLDQALASGPVSAMPVRGVLRQRQTPVHIYWSP